MLTVTAMNVVSEAEAAWQLSVFETEEELRRREKQENLERAIDQIRTKFGKESVKRAAVLDNDLGISGSVTEKQE